VLQGNILCWLDDSPQPPNYILSLVANITSHYWCVFLSLLAVFVSLLTRLLAGSLELCEVDKVDEITCWAEPGGCRGAGTAQHMLVAS
jgi:hypothetical protein